MKIVKHIIYALAFKVMQVSLALKYVMSVWFIYFSAPVILHLYLHEMTFLCLCSKTGMTMRLEIHGEARRVTE